MAGIVFLRTRMFDAVREFYTGTVGMEVWLEQPGIAILKHGNMLVGLHEQPGADMDGLLTFFEPEREYVDQMHELVKDAALGQPKENPKYRIYHFFARDPEGRKVEFQSFLHPVEPYLAGADALATRRSIRRFTEDDVPDELISRVLESCRFAPTARNSQPCYFVVTRDREKIARLAAIREGSGAPIGRAPVVVTICADPAVSGRYVQDGCIVTYHFMLAAWLFGLGTCWIGGMDRDEVKDILDIPKEHYVVTVTPLGRPAESPELKPRKPVEELLRKV